jgi:hypothetical protein
MAMKTLRTLALMLALVVPVPLQAQTLIAEYQAYIGPNDLYNSNGQRLTEPWQVLRQDRANYHRFNIWDNGDEWDPVFSRFDTRAQFEQLIRRGRIDPQARRMIMQGGALVHVRVYGTGDRPQSVQVDVSR